MLSFSSVLVIVFRKSVRICVGVFVVGICFNLISVVFM